MEPVLWLLVGLFVGVVIGALAMLAKSRSDISTVEADRVRLSAQLDESHRRLDEQGDIENTLLDRFKLIASEAISRNNETFLTSADQKIGTLVKPLSEELRRIETDRAKAEGSLTQQIQSLALSSRALEQETRNLSTALKAPQVRGRWGEIQLRRVAELAGMIDYCDFREQVSIAGEDGTTDRPDMVVYMPSDRTIVVDAKTPLNAYLEAVESETDDQREAALVRHANQVRERATSLTRSAYWNSLDRSPEFVVMFLPGEFFLQPALERDPDLLERVLASKVVIATPSTLIALLRTVEMGWKEAKLAEEARQIGELGRELHDRLATYAEHIAKVGSSLSTVVRNFNASVGSFDSRVAVSARRFKELGIQTSEEMPEISEIDIQIRRGNSTLTGNDAVALKDGDTDEF